MQVLKASANPYREIKWISTGLSSLDRILGGGIPHRKLTEISGQFSMGKSTLALQIVAEAQKGGTPCLWVDTEFSYTEEYASALGVNSDQLDLYAGRYAEENLDYIEEWAESNKNSLIVLDSIGGLLPRAEAEKGADGKVIGGQAKLIATFTRKMTPVLAINNIALVVLNHQFTDIMSGKLKTSGGAKLEYSKSIWLMLRSANKRVMKGDQQIGMIVEAEIRKNKLAPTVKQKVPLTMLYGTGFSADADLLQDLLDSGEVTKKGNTYYRGDQKLGIGKTKAYEALKAT
jgi:recombination protein RecA